MIVRSVFGYDPTGLRPAGAILRALGVALSAVGGEAIGGHGAAVLAGVGALYAGIASFGGVHQARLRRMLAAIVAASAATLLGSLVQPSDLLTVVATFGVSLALGVFAAVGPDAAQVALLGTGTLVVFSGVHGASAHPLQNALLVLGGGMGQVVILMAFRPVSPLAAERRAVATVYASLARFSRERASGQRTTPLAGVVEQSAARDLLREAFGFGKPPALSALWSELELADALRANLAGLDRSEVAPETWSKLAGWFEQAAGAVARGRPIDRRAPSFPESMACSPWTVRVRRVIESPGIGGLDPATPIVSAWFRALRNVGNLREIVLGHALRYAVALTLATAGYRILGVDHGYWAPLALAFSLRADFAGTITRGLGRIVGTVLGVSAATGLVAFLHPGTSALTVAMLVAAYFAFTLMGASFVAYSAALAFYVVVSVVLAGAAASTVGLERVASTVVGSLLALVAALVWPRWEAGKARKSLAVAFAAQAQYADAVRAFESPEAVAGARFGSRAARLEAERVVGVAALEPAWSRMDHLSGTDAALARLAENAARILSAHAAALDPHEDDAPEDLGRIAEEDRGFAADLMG